MDSAPPCERTSMLSLRSVKFAYIKMLFTGKASTPEECIRLTAEALRLPVWAVKTILWREPIPDDILDEAEISFTEIVAALDQVIKD